MNWGKRIILLLALSLAVLYPTDASAGSGRKVSGEGKLLGKTVSGKETVAFGSWEQDENHSGKEDIEWRVLEIDSDRRKALLLTENCIDAMPWDVDDKAEKWEDASLKNWLNTLFFTDAFEEDEADRISGDVFLLDKDQVEEYFTEKADRKAYPAPRLKPSEEEEDDDGDDGEVEYAVSELTDAMFWWLSSVGDEEKCVQCVGAEGTIVTIGYNRLEPGFGVRPAIWVSLD